jgi:LmbE family N-acetylglucosaminyl deacetylase
VLTVSETSLGTPESRWRAAAELAALPAAQWGAPARVIVVAPHPDDEVLGVGGVVRHLASMGAEIVIVSVTDGERSHPGSRAMARADLANARRAERAAALRHLGLVDPVVDRLRIPDGDVARFEAELAATLHDHLEPGSLCLSTWRHDGHPDHDATGRASAQAARERGATLLEYPVWAWHWATPGASVPSMRQIPWARARRHDLDRRAQRAKHAAIEAYATQIAPIGPEPADRAVLPGAVLDRFRRSFEVLFFPERGHAVTTPLVADGPN